MTENLYTQYANKYYNPNDDGKKPGDNENWESIQKGFHRIGSTQLETSAGLTLGKGTEDETSVTAAELKEIKNPTQLETSGGLTLGKSTADEVSVTAAELATLKSGGIADFFLIKQIGSTVVEDIAAGATIDRVLFTNAEFRRAVPANATGLYGIGVISGAGAEYRYSEMPPLKVYTKLNDIPASKDYIPITKGEISHAFENVSGTIYFTNPTSAQSRIPTNLYLVVAFRLN